MAPGVRVASSAPLAMSSREQFAGEPQPLPGTPLEVPVPPNLAEAFGYRGGARYVGFHWEPAGDELVYDDGRLSGTGDPWAFLAFRRHPAVEPHLEAFNLGYSDLEAEHCLILDRAEEQAAVAPIAAARAFLQAQHPPAPPLAPAEIAAVQQAIEEALRARSREVRIDPEVVRRWMDEQRQAIERMLAYLDQWPDVSPERHGA